MKSWGLQRQVLHSLLAAGLLFPLAACAPAPAVITPAENGLPALVLVNGVIIDGTGAAPQLDAVLVIQGEKITALGPRSRVALPQKSKVVDLQGSTILPGFINAHVHDAFDADRLKAWAAAGVTTVRDEGAFFSLQTARYRETKSASLKDPALARLVSAGQMITVPGGYGSLQVTSPEDAAQKVADELDQGADLVKLALEDGYAGRSGLPKLSSEELAAVISTAHKRGKLVSAHVTQGVYLQAAVEAGIDDAAHMVYNDFPPGLIARMVQQDIYIVPTLTVLEAYGSLEPTQRNLREFVAAGGKVALGNDYTRIPQNNFDHFDLGMPMHEIERMAEAGLTPMQIIVAATKNAAHVSGLEQVLGTLEVGKIADVLVVGGDPLVDLQALQVVRMVIHGGQVIREETPDNSE